MAQRTNWSNGLLVAAVLGSFSTHAMWERRSQRAQDEAGQANGRAEGRADQDDPDARQAFERWGTELLPGRIPAAELPTPDSLGVAVIQGADALGDAPADRAVRAELARWAAPERLPLEVELLAVGPLQGGWRPVDFRARGAEAEVLAWLQHLLAGPGASAGYLSDPARILLDSLGGGRLALELRLRIWPHAAFTEGAR